MRPLTRLDQSPQPTVRTDRMTAKIITITTSPAVRRPTATTSHRSWGARPTTFKMRDKIKSTLKRAKLRIAITISQSNIVKNPGVAAKTAICLKGRSPATTSPTTPITRLCDPRSFGPWTRSTQSSSTHQPITVRTPTEAA